MIRMANQIEPKRISMAVGDEKSKQLGIRQGPHEAVVEDGRDISHVQEPAGEIPDDRRQQQLLGIRAQPSAEDSRRGVEHEKIYKRGAPVKHQHAGRCIGQWLGCNAMAIYRQEHQQSSHAARAP